jgi:hypothetical protein
MMKKLLTYLATLVLVAQTLLPTSLVSVYATDETPEGGSQAVQIDCGAIDESIDTEGLNLVNSLDEVDATAEDNIYI